MKKQLDYRASKKQWGFLSFGKTKSNHWHGVKNYLHKFNKVKNNNDCVKLVKDYSTEFDLGINDPVKISEKIQTNFIQFAKWCKAKLL